MTETGDRRPLASRGTGWAQMLARKLAATEVTPNQISQASVVAAAVAGFLLWLGPGQTGSLHIVLLVGAAVFIQLRLLCNLMDGMVAVEAGKASPDGPFWNEVPDRVADMLIIIGAGYGTGNPTLGWAAAAFAFLTAYLREFGRAQGLPADYRGPMAKPHRMAALTVAAFAAALEPMVLTDPVALTVGLFVVAIGAAITSARRALAILRAMT